MGSGRSRLRVFDNVALLAEGVGLQLGQKQKSTQLALAYMRGFYIEEYYQNVPIIL